MHFLSTLGGCVNTLKILIKLSHIPLSNSITSTEQSSTHTQNSAVVIHNRMQIQVMTSSCMSYELQLFPCITLISVSGMACLPRPGRSKVTQYLCFSMSTASILPVKNPLSLSVCRRAAGKEEEEEEEEEEVRRKKLSCQLAYSPVTDVPTTSRAGSSSGMSLYVEKSVTVI